MKLFGIICFSIMFSWMFTGLDWITGNGYVFDFINKESLQIATTLLGFNIAVHTILIGQINNMETLVQKFNIFDNTKRELKHNAVFNLLLIVLIFFFRVLKLTPTSPLALTIGTQYIGIINYTLEIFILSCLVLIFYLIYETVQAVFGTFGLKKK